MNGDSFFMQISHFLATIASMSVSKDSYKGVRDFYPEDWAKEKQLFAAMRNVVERFGYVEYNASPLESSELYAAKSGEEIVNEQTYTFIDRGGRNVTLRPEMTPTVARMIAARKRELSYPIRWYSIPNLFRYEQPQRGRLREHFQLNVDLFGIKGLEAEIEINALAHSIMRELGAKDSDFEIRINSRTLLQSKLLPKLKNTDDYQKALKLIDKKDKLPQETFAEEWAKISNEPFEINRAANDTIDSLIASLKKLGITNAKYHETLVRGFDYYTDIVFEVFDTNPENRRSLFGGGRYDELLSIFDEETMPAVGFGMGDVTALDFLETHKLGIPYRSTTALAICVMPGIDNDAVSKLAATLRDGGVNVAIDWSGRKIGDQIKAADKQHIAHIIVFGEEELGSNSFTLKELSSGNETKMTVEEIIATLRK